jgi:hypothetical protein
LLLMAPAVAVGAAKKATGRASMRHLPGLGEAAPLGRQNAPRAPATARTAHRWASLSEAPSLVWLLGPGGDRGGGRGRVFYV